MRNRVSLENRPQRLARTAAVLVTAAVLMAGPGIAHAAFTSTASGQVTASSLNLSTLTNASLDVTCPRLAGSLKIQLVTPVEKATRHTVTVTRKPVFSPRETSTVELSVGNPYQSQAGLFVEYTYEVTAYYDVKVGGKVVNTWSSEKSVSGAC